MEAEDQLTRISGKKNQWSNPVLHTSEVLYELSYVGRSRAPVYLCRMGPHVARAADQRAGACRRGGNRTARPNRASPDGGVPSGLPVPGLGAMREWLEGHHDRLLEDFSRASALALVERVDFLPSLLS
jgi:hypothetical protein